LYLIVLITILILIVLIIVLLVVVLKDERVDLKDEDDLVLIFLAIANPIQCPINNISFQSE
jgi:hypothetical protein